MSEHQSGTRKGKILIVDDTPDNLRLLMSVLTERGYDVRPASNGSLALKMVQATLPDLILLDIKMPGMDGYNVCSQLKADKRTYDIPVIFISALTEVMDKVKGFSLGGVDYITKPFQAEEVLARVETHVTLRKLQKRLQEKNTQLQQEIVKREQAEEGLRSLNQRLEEVNASKDVFLSIVAHDLRNPLGALRELPGLILENIDLYSKDDIVKMTTIQKDAAENLWALLENLLTWSRVQRGVIKYNPQPTNIAEIVSRNVNLLLPGAERKQIALETSLPNELWGYADYHMTDAVIRNLLSNALKFTNIYGTVNVSAVQKEECVEVSVSDTGIGIKEEYLSKLFRIDVKYKREGTAHEPGTGLGLILCKEFVKKHGGEIWVESEAGKGTTFRFTLPIASAKLQEEKIMLLRA